MAKALDLLILVEVFKRDAYSLENRNVCLVAVGQADDVPRPREAGLGQYLGVGSVALDNADPLGPLFDRFLAFFLNIDDHDAVAMRKNVSGEDLAAVAHATDDGVVAEGETHPQVVERRTAETEVGQDNSEHG